MHTGVQPLDQDDAYAIGVQRSHESRPSRPVRGFLRATATFLAVEDRPCVHGQIIWPPD